MIWLSGSALPASMTDAAVSALNVEPGLERGGERARTAVVLASIATGSFGSTVGTSATARSRPVFASMHGHRRPLGAGRLHLRLGDALHSPLQIGVDRELQRAAVVRLLVHDLGAGDLHPVLEALQVAHLAVLARRGTRPRRARARRAARRRRRRIRPGCRRRHRSGSGGSGARTARPTGCRAPSPAS